MLGQRFDKFEIIMGLFWDYLGSFWDIFGIILGAFWEHFWIIFDHFGVILGSWGAPGGPGGPQEGPKSAQERQNVSFDMLK